MVLREMRENVRRGSMELVEPKRQPADNPTEHEASARTTSQLCAGTILASLGSHDAQPYGLAQEWRGSNAVAALHLQGWLPYEDEIRSVEGPDAGGGGPGGTATAFLRGRRD